MILSVPVWLAPNPEQLGAALVRVALTLGGAWIVQRVGFLLVWRLERWLGRVAHGGAHAVQRAKTLGQMFRHLITTLVAAVALVHVLEILGWDVKPLLVGASILGAALGFGAQFLVRDIIAGAFILAEDQFAVGDQVEVNGQIAVVEAVTLRSTRLRDPFGRLLFVPNGEMKIVINHSRGWHLAIVDLPLAANQDFDRVFAVAAEVAASVNASPELRAQLQEPLKVAGLDRIGPEGAVLRLTARANPGAGVALVTRETRRLALLRLREAGIRSAAGTEHSIVNVPTPPPVPPADAPASG